MFTGILGGLSLVLTWFGCSSLTGKSLEGFRTYDNMPGWLPTLPDLLPVEHTPMSRLRLLARFLMMIYSWS